MAFGQSVAEGTAQQLIATVALHHTSKALAAKVIPRVRAAFEASAGPALPRVAALYRTNAALLLDTLSKFSQGTVSGAQLSSEGFATVVKLAWYALKAACSLLLYGVPAPASNDAACAFLTLLLEHIKAFEACRASPLYLSRSLSLFSLSSLLSLLSLCIPLSISLTLSPRKCA